MLRRLLLLSILAVSAVTASAQNAAPEGIRYKESGYTAIRRLGIDLYKALKVDQRNQINKEPLFLDTDMTPSLKLVEYPDEKQPMRAVFITVGFADLANYVAHAKAIDKIQKGYFQAYILSLGGESGEKELKPLPDISNLKFWSDRMLNEQLSNFNQISGVAVGTKLAHHYLGHFKKYSAQLTDEKGNDIAINSVISLEDWQLAHRAGMLNSMNAGYTLEGIKALYEAIDKMPKRPGWTVNFLPPGIQYVKLKKEIDKFERDFFDNKIH